MRIDDLLRSARGSFAPNELAYLALTGSLQAALRDRIAFAAHAAPETEAEGWIVARDQRNDVTVLRSEHVAAAVFEIESVYTFDAVLSPKQVDLWAIVQTDIDKCRGRSMSAAAASYCILTMTHALQRIPERLFGAVPRAADINRGHSAFHRLDDLAAAATTFVCEAFEDHGARAVDVPRAGGVAFGIPVEVHWFVLDIGRAS